MPILDIARVFAANKVLRSSFHECRLCLKDVEKAGRSLVVSPLATPKEFMISAASFPVHFYLPHRNFFSTLFQTVYGFLGIPKERRMFYGRINYLFRIWVTSADNLLDGEDKISLAIKMPVDSRVMRQVVALMAADRILGQFLDDAVSREIITRDQSLVISSGTLQVLLPSAAEEASEEKGIVRRPRPEYVLNTIHQLKTALLFHLPLFAPQQIEKDLDHQVLESCRQGLGQFGLGCQLLDDIRDLARDHMERRHNYALSLITHQSVVAVKRLRAMEGALSVDRAIFSKFPDELAPVAQMAHDYMLEGMRHLNACGLALGEETAHQVALWMFKALDVEKARGWLK